MPTLSDERFQALRDQGFTGATSDMILQWLQDAGATANAVPDAWKQMLLDFTGLPEENYHRNDYWYQLLEDLGYDGQMNDREMAFWEDGGVLSTDGVKITTQPIQLCYGEGLHTYTVVAESGNGSALTYQWQELLASVWTDIAGATAATYAPVLAYPESDGVSIRCVVCNDVNCRNSATVTICYTGITIGIITEDGLDDTFSEDGATEIIEDRF